MLTVNFYTDFGNTRDSQLTASPAVKRHSSGPGYSGTASNFTIALEYRCHK